MNINELNTSAEIFKDILDIMEKDDRSELRAFCDKLARDLCRFPDVTEARKEGFDEGFEEGYNVGFSVGEMSVPKDNIHIPT